MVNGDKAKVCAVISSIEVKLDSILVMLDKIVKELEIDVTGSVEGDESPSDQRVQ